VFDKQQRLRGYQMPRIEKQYADSLDIWIQEKSRRLFNLSMQYRDRLTIANRLAQLVASLHKQDIFVIDLKPTNTLVYDRIYQPVLIDCDSFSLKDSQGNRFPAHQYTSDYIAPEALREQLRPEQLGIEQDQFALAVIVFQLMNQGLHPFQGGFRNPVDGIHSNDDRVLQGWYAYGLKSHEKVVPSRSSIHRSFTSETRALFDRAFISTESRPSAQEWAEHLDHFLQPDNHALNQCAANPDHQFFSPACPFCELGLEQATASGPQFNNTYRPESVTLPTQTNRVFHYLSNSMTLSYLAVPVLVGMLAWNLASVKPLFYYTGLAVVGLIITMVVLGRIQTRYHLGSRRKSMAFTRFSHKMFRGMIAHIGIAFLMNFFGLFVGGIRWLSGLVTG
jgi:DNA-binding helix-hairpin-helix protein with protein kinase domain